MLNTKLNLYNPDWIEFVFDDRNKAYGAYDLRNHYAGNMVKAMSIAFTTVVAAAILLNIATKHKPAATGDHTIVFTLPQVPVMAIPKKAEPPKVMQAKQTPPVAIQKFISFKVIERPDDVEPPKITELTGVIGSENIKGPDNGMHLDYAPLESNSGGSTAAIEDPREKIFITVEKEPEPFGGTEGWAKFLGKTLRYPGQALDAGKSGRVIITFVIEKDGHLSNISVVKGAGFGMDEEAVRVLKLAKPWKPGTQNGQAVRVQYMIPINFQMPD